MQTNQWQNLGVSELEANEFESIYGGSWPVWLKGVTWVGIASEVIDNWDEIKKGLVDGWNAVELN